MSYRNIVIVGLALAVALACRSVATKSRYASLFAEVLTKVDDYALEPTNERSLYEHAMQGMLKSLDEYSQFISGDSYRVFEQQLKQEFGGIGMFVGVHPRTKELTVTATLPETPAQQAGILPGDVLLRIGETRSVNILPAAAVEVIQGPIGTPVELELRRGTEVFRRNLVRAPIAIKTVRGERFRTDGSWNFLLPEDSRIAYVQITDFSEKTSAELREVLTSAAASAQALIVDLRSNGGGLLEDAVEICDMFLDKPQPIVEIRGRNQELVEPPSRSTGQCLFAADKPLVILIDHYSASASEIVAACLQDWERATVIGEPSYGKGTVQSVIPVERNRSSLKVTTATWWTPAGRNIDREPKYSKSEQPGGVQPNPGFEFHFDDATRFQIDLLRARRQFQTLDIFGGAGGGGEQPVENAAPAAGAPPSADGADVPPSATLTVDPVLERAVQWLRETLDKKSSTEISRRQRIASLQ